MATEGNVVLADGRVMTYAEYGSPEGRPVFYFHGSPSSRLEPLLIGDDVFAQHGLRIIERPMQNFLPLGGTNPRNFCVGPGSAETRAALAAFSPKDADRLGSSARCTQNDGGGQRLAQTSGSDRERRHPQD